MTTWSDEAVSNNRSDHLVFVLKSKQTNGNGWIIRLLGLILRCTRRGFGRFSFVSLSPALVIHRCSFRASGPSNYQSVYSVCSTWSQHPRQCSNIHRRCYFIRTAKANKNEKPAEIWLVTPPYSSLWLFKLNDTITLQVNKTSWSISVPITCRLSGKFTVRFRPFTTRLIADYANK